MTLCPRYGFELAVPCGLDKCPCHVVDESVKCCALEGPHALDSSPMTPEEVSAMTGTEPEEVERCMARFLNSVRCGSVEPFLNAGNGMDFIPDSGLCVSCGSEGDIPVGGEDGLVYCSEDCRRIFPESLVSLCRELSSDPDSVLVAMARCMSGERIASVLGMSGEDVAGLYSARFGLSVVGVTSGPVEPDREFHEPSGACRFQLIRRYTEARTPVLDGMAVASNM